MRRVELRVSDDLPQMAIRIQEDPGVASVKRLLSGLDDRAPARRACSITALTSSLEDTLCPIVKAVGDGAETSRPESCEMLLRGQSASRRPDCSSKNTTAPNSNSWPTIPSVMSPRPSR